MADEAAPSFAAQIKPLFRESDRYAMAFAFDLWSYDDVKLHAQAILACVRAGSMPCDEPWDSERVALFERWTQTGTAP